MSCHFFSLVVVPVPPKCPHVSSHTHSEFQRVFSQSSWMVCGLKRKPLTLTLTLTVWEQEAQDQFAKDAAEREAGVLRDMGQSQ